MARRPGEDERSLSPRTRRITGWIAAAALLAAIAVAVGIVGGRGEGAPDASGGTSPVSDGDVPTITFGTSLDPDTGAVAEAATTTRFSDGDDFAYSVRTPEPPPGTVYIEVERLPGTGDLEQSPTPQAVAPGSGLIGVDGIAASTLLNAWGPGEYRLRIRFDPTGDVVAQGVFRLERPAASGGTAP